MSTKRKRVQFIDKTTPSKKLKIIEKTIKHNNSTFKVYSSSKFHT